VSAGKNEPVAVEPVGIAGTVFEKARPQCVRHRRAAHRQAGVSAVRFLNRVYREKADGVDAELVELVGWLGGWVVGHSSFPNLDLILYFAFSDCIPINFFRGR